MKICVKYDSEHVISESGNNLSGGEKQKIALARLLARNTDTIFLDEFTANINKEAAKEIEKYIFSLDKTVIMISHRVSEEIMNMADDIIYL